VGLKEFTCCEIETTFNMTDYTELSVLTFDGQVSFNFKGTFRVLCVLSSAGIIR